MSVSIYNRDHSFNTQLLLYNNSVLVDRLEIFMIKIKKKAVKYLLLSLFSILFVDLSFSQDIFKATVSTSNHKPLDKIYVMAYRDASFEDSFFAGSFDGNAFQFSVADSIDCFYIRVSNLEYELYESKICKPVKDTHEIVLRERLYELQTVEIQGLKKTEVLIRGSVAEIRPGDLLTGNSALSADNLVKSLPEVLVSTQGEILVRGRKIEDIQLFISPNSPSKAISTGELSNISVKDIESIKIDYLLSSISVYLKKMKSQGIAGNSRLRQIQGKKAYGSLTQGLRVNRGDTYYWLDLGAKYIDTKPESSSKYLLRLPEDEIVIADANSISRVKQKSFNSKLYVEHRFDSIYTAGLQLSYSISESPDKSQVYSNIGVSNTSQSVLDNKSNNYFLAPSLFLQGVYANGWKLVLRAGMLSSLQKSDNLGVFNHYLHEQAISSSQVLNQRNETNAYTASIAAVKQWNKTSLNLSAKGNYLDNKTDSDYHHNLIGQTPLDSVFSNQIKEYKFELEAAINTVLWGKYLTRLTSNFMHYDYSFYDTNSEELLHTKMVRVLPGFSISAPIKEAKYLTLYGNSYMRSPNFRNLIFSNSSADGFTDNQNNYKLKPFTSYQLGLSYPLIPNTITSIYWSTTDNMNMNYPYFSDTGTFEGNRKINLSDSQSLGLSLFYSNTLLKRIFITANANIMHNSWKNRGEYAFSTDFVSGMGNLNIYYSSKTDWSFNLDYTYSSKQKLSEDIELRNNYLMDFSVSKTLNNSWSTFFKVNNLLNSSILNIYGQNPILYETTFNQDQRFITLGINYSFNKNFKNKRHEENLMEDIDKRIRMSE